MTICLRRFRCYCLGLWIDLSNLTSSPSYSENSTRFRSTRWDHEMYCYYTKPPKCRVFGAPYSIGTSRVVVTLNEYDIDYQLRIFDTANRGLRILTKEHQEPRYLAVQPFGKTPLFQDHEVTIFESRAVIRHIARKHDAHGPPLYGTNEKERTMVDQWLEVEGQNYNPAIAPVVYHLVFAAWFGKIGDIRVVDTSVERLEKVLDIYEAQLMKTQYLAGDFCSIADLSHLPFTYYLIEHAGRDDLFRDRPHVYKWWVSIATRPSWVKHLSTAYPKIHMNKEDCCH